MGRAPCCSKVGLRRGAWTTREDAVLKKYVETHGEGRWRSVPKKAGLLRCGKSCRLRWLNYLRPSIKRGNIEPEEDDIIIKLHALLGNRWALIAKRLPGRTDNEIKNYWNAHLSKVLKTRGVDPTTHKLLPQVGGTPHSSPQTCGKGPSEDNCKLKLGGGGGGGSSGERRPITSDSNNGGRKIYLPKANRAKPFSLNFNYGPIHNQFIPVTQSQEREDGTEQHVVTKEDTDVMIAPTEAIACEKTENVSSVSPPFSWKEWEESLDFLTISDGDMGVGIEPITDTPFNVEEDAVVAGTMATTAMNEPAFSWKLDCGDDQWAVDPSKDDVLQKVYEEFLDLVSYDGNNSNDGPSN